MKSSIESRMSSPSNVIATNAGFAMTGPPDAPMYGGWSGAPASSGTHGGGAAPVGGEHFFPSGTYTSGFVTTSVDAPSFFFTSSDASPTAASSSNVPPKSVRPPHAIHAHVERIPQAKKRQRIGAILHFAAMVAS